MYFLSILLSDHVQNLYGSYILGDDQDKLCFIALALSSVSSMQPAVNLNIGFFCGLFKRDLVKLLGGDFI